MFSFGQRYRGKGNVKEQETHFLKKSLSLEHHTSFEASFQLTILHQHFLSSFQLPLINHIHLFFLANYVRVGRNGRVEFGGHRGGKGLGCAFVGRPGLRAPQPKIRLEPNSRRGKKNYDCTIFVPYLQMLLTHGRDLPPLTFHVLTTVR